MYIFYILNVTSSPLAHTHFSVGGCLVVDLTSFKRNIFRSFLFFCFSSKHAASMFSQSVLCEQTCLSAPDRSFIKKEITHSATCLGSPHPATPSDTQAKPGWTKRFQAQALQPCQPSGLQSSNLQLVKLQKALTSTMVKGLFVPARRDFFLHFLFSVLAVCCGFKLKKKKKGRKKKKKDKVRNV